MTGQTPVEAHRKPARYVEAQPASGPHRPAMPAHWVIEEDGEVFTRALDVTELAQHRDDIARVAYEWWDGAEPWADVPEDSREQFRGMADAVLAYLAGGAR